MSACCHVQLVCMPLAHYINHIVVASFITFSILSATHTGKHRYGYSPHYIIISKLDQGSAFHTAPVPCAYMPHQHLLSPSWEFCLNTGFVMLPNLLPVKQRQLAALVMSSASTFSSLWACSVAKLGGQTLLKICSHIRPFSFILSGP